MKDTNVLIKEYWEGKLSADEKLLLLEMLDEKITDFSDEEYYLFTKLLNENQTAANKSNIVLNKQLKGIENKLGFDDNQTLQVYSIRHNNKWKWMAAASIILVAVCAWWLTNTQQRSKTNAKQDEVLAQVTYSNSGNSVVDTLMPDGSIIRLYPQTIVSFTDGFKGKERVINLSGKAIFKVSKDTSRPFIVYAGGFSTRALGTQFEVNTNEKGKFFVRLIEGKVVIKAHEKKEKPFADIYLTSGQDLVYDILKQEVITKNKQEIAVNKSTKISKDKPVIDNKAELSFSKLPLQVVLKQLEEEFSIMIIYDFEKIKDKEFTGSFNKSNTPLNVIKTICKKYGWKVKFENRAFIIE